VDEVSERSGADGGGAGRPGGKGLILEVPEMELLDAFLRTATTAFVFLFLLMVLLVS
jgi:hypothetical protein